MSTAETPRPTTDSTQLTGPPTAGTEIETLVGSLERQRRTFAWKTGGLDAPALRTTLGASSMTLGGLVKHLATVEAIHFTYRLHGRDPGAPVNTVDWDGDPDWAWRSAGSDGPAELYDLYGRSVTKARSDLAEALLAGAGAPIWERYGEAPAQSTRRLLVDVIGEYARHTGHADLLRESVDGLVGDDPPSP